MFKGISEVVVVILVLLIGLSLASALYVFSRGSILQIFPNETSQREFQRSRACLSLEDINITSGVMKMRNCGLVPLKSFGIFIDGSKLNISYPEKLDPTQSFAVNFSPLSGEHSFLAVSDLAETPLIKVM